MGSDVVVRLILGIGNYPKWLASCMCSEQALHRVQWYEVFMCVVGIKLNYSARTSICSSARPVGECLWMKLKSFSLHIDNYS